MIKITEKPEKHFVVELIERFEKNWIAHEGSHKITIDGVSIEGPFRGKTKNITLKGNLSIDVKTKK